MLDTYIKPYLARYRPYKGGAWCYEDGCIYRGLALLHEVTGEAQYLDILQTMADAQLDEDGALVGYDHADFNIDNILPGRALIYLFRVTGAKRYRAGADRLAAQLRDHPRTKSGVYWHKKRYPHQVWLDGLYMGLPFQIEYGQLSRNEGLVDDALTQLRTAIVLTRRPGGGLYSHGYDEKRAQPWSDPETGQSEANWARALGWLAMALVDILELTDGDGRDTADIAALAAAYLSNVERYETGNRAWYQVIDRPDLAGNYEEASSSAMFHYALMKAERLGLLEPRAERPQAFRSFLSRFIGRSQGEAVLRDICEVAGLGQFGKQYRDGSAKYYLSERRIDDDAKGAGPLMMAYSECLRVEATAVSLCK